MVCTSQLNSESLALVRRKGLVKPAPAHVIKPVALARQKPHVKYNAHGSCWLSYRHDRPLAQLRALVCAGLTDGSSLTPIYVTYVRACVRMYPCVRGCMRACVHGCVTTSPAGRAPRPPPACRPFASSPSDVATCVIGAG